MAIVMIIQKGERMKDLIITFHDKNFKSYQKNSFLGDNVRDSHTVAAGGRKKHSLLPDRIKYKGAARQ